MKNDVMSISDSENQSTPDAISHNQMSRRANITLRQALMLIEELEEAIKTSNTLVHALLDGSANDKKIGKFILKTAKQTDALLDHQTCKELYALLESSTDENDQSD